VLFRSIVHAYMYLLEICESTMARVDEFSPWSRQFVNYRYSPISAEYIVLCIIYCYLLL